MTAIPIRSNRSTNSQLSRGVSRTACLDKLRDKTRRAYYGILRYMHALCRPRGAVDSKPLLVRATAAASHFKEMISQSADAAVYPKSPTIRSKPIPKGRKSRSVSPKVWLNSRHNQNVLTKITTSVTATQCILNVCNAENLYHF